MDAKDLYALKTSSPAALANKAVLLFDSDGEPTAFDASTLFNPAYKDLSMYDHQGQSLLSRSTANTYVVNKPGYYMFPFVYGNAIKNGQANEAAYTNQGGSNQANFVNHLGNQLTSPYLEGNSGCTPSSVEVSFQTANGLIKDLGTVAGGDCGYAKFTIESIPTGGGYAVISAKTSGGVIIWSWNIWLYPDDLTEIEVTNHGNVKYKMLPVNLCAVKNSNVPNRNPHWQWGRPALIPHVSGYNGGGTAVSVTIASGPAADIATGIKNPLTFYLADGNNNNDWQSGVATRYNHWDAAKSSAGATDSNVVKTIYDPSPVGFKIPPANAFTGFTTTGGNTSTAGEFNVVGSFSDGWKFKRNSNDVAGNFFPASGYRNYSSGALGGVGSDGNSWSSAPYGATNAYYLYFNSGDVYPLYYGSRAYGFSVRPVRE